MIVAGSFVMLALPAVASAARGMELALQDDKVFVSDERPGVERGLELARRLGVTTIRSLVVWRDRPDFAAHDRLVAAAAVRGMRVQLNITGVPRWGGSNARTDTRRPSAAGFAKFARAVATHFRGRVHRYSIWNEPNWRTWLLPPRRSPIRYRELYRRAYAVIKGVDSRAQVLLGELAPHQNPPWSIGPLEFLRGMTCVHALGRRGRGCEPLRADGIALHPYDFTHPPGWKHSNGGSVTIGTLSRLTAELRRLRRSRALTTPRGGVAPVYLTEFGYFAAGRRGLSSRTRARRLPRAFELALRHPGVRQMTLFGLVHSPGSKWNVGVVNKNGQPDAAFRALKRWAHRRAKAGLIARARR